MIFSNRRFSTKSWLNPNVREYWSIFLLSSGSLQLDGHYMLSDITLEILKYINVIEEIESKKSQYKYKEHVKTDRDLTSEDKQKILEALKL
jgi:hypothetical protein